jgi:AraC-like DNA-binding protein
MQEILYIGLSQSLFAGLMISIKKPQQLADRILAAWLFMISLEMAIAIINIKFITVSAFAVVPFTYGPLLYFYVKSLTTEKPKIKLSFWLHFIPFILFLILSVIYRDKDVINLLGFFNIDAYIKLRVFYSASFFISITTYSLITFVIIAKHQRNIKNLFSYTSEKITLSWLKFVSIFFYITYLLMFSGGLITIVEKLNFNPIEVSYFGLTLFAFAFSFYGYKQSGILSEFDKTLIIENNKKKKPRYEKSGLKKKDAEIILKRLLEYMGKDKPYLKSNLTIQDLADSLDVSRHHLTQVINEKLNKNFYTFINEYRVEEMKRKLLNKKYNKYTLDVLAYDSGFNSKSSFHSAFKSITGMTPAEFKKKNNHNS